MKSNLRKSVYNPIVILTTAIAILTLAFSSCTKEATDGLKETFKNPPHPAKPWVYWINMDGHFTKEGQ